MSIAASAPRRIRTRGCTGLASSADWVAEELRGQPNVLGVRRHCWNAPGDPNGGGRGQARVGWVASDARPMRRARVVTAAAPARDSEGRLQLQESLVVHEPDLVRLGIELDPL